MHGERRKYRFHLLGLVHLPCRREYASCAFTQKNWKLSEMLLSLGHEVIYYGAEGSEISCTEFVQTHSLADIAREWGDGDNRFEIGYNWRETDFRHDFNKPRTPTTLKFYDACVEGINDRKRPDDFILVTQGIYQKPITDRLDLFLKCESGIGYLGSCKEFYRAFESDSLRHFAYGSENPGESIDGNFYDRVIPNYFDPADFEVNLYPEDYYLYIGRIIWRKGIQIAYEACREMGKKLVIAGQGGLVRKDGRFVSTTDPGLDLPADGVWDYAGFAGPEERKRLMSRAIATFVPSIYLEPFGGVHIESMMCGTPPICTDFGVFPQTIPDHLNGQIGFRCNTLDDFVQAGIRARYANRAQVANYAQRFHMDRVRWDYQRWFDDLYEVYLSTVDPGEKGWYRVRSL